MDISGIVFEDGGNKLISRVENIIGKKPISGDDLVVAAIRLRENGETDYYHLFELASRLDRNSFFDEFNYLIARYEVSSQSENVQSRIEKLKSLLQYSYESFYCIELICLYLSLEETSKSRRLLTDTRNLLGSSNTLDDLWNDIKNGSENYREYLKTIDSQRKGSDKNCDLKSEVVSKETIKTHKKQEISSNNNEPAYCELVETAFAGLIGMTEVKNQLDKIYKRVILDNARKKYNSGQNNAKSYNFVLCGNPGTGKTTVARIIAKLLYQTGVLETETFIETDRSKLVGQYIGDTEHNTRKVIEKARGGVIFIDEAYNLFEENSEKDYGKHVIETLLKDMEDNRGKYSVIIAGYKQKMDNMMKKANVGFSSRFDYHINIPDYSDEELYQILLRMADSCGMTICTDAKSVIFDRIKRERIDETFDNARFMRRLLDNALESQADRLHAMKEIRKDDLFVLTSNDFVSSNSSGAVLSLEDYLNQLNNMIGLEPVKRDIKGQIDSISIQNERKTRGIAAGITTHSYHMAFTGNPGTGKTTVARLYGKVLAQLGILKREDVFVECTRADLVAGYQGQTAIKTKEIIQTALGGVLFIDEAYDLVTGENDSFGLEAVSTLIAEMENKRDRLVVIFAGYSNEMAAFMNTNPGIRSRVSKVIEFPDYSKDELVDIFYYEMNKRGYILDSVDREDVCTMIVERMNDKDFGNARGVRNICDIVERNMSYRLNSEIKRNLISDEDLVRILSDDLHY